MSEESLYWRVQNWDSALAGLEKALAELREVSAELAERYELRQCEREVWQSAERALSLVDNIRAEVSRLRSRDVYVPCWAEKEGSKSEEGGEGSGA